MEHELELHPILWANHCNTLLRAALEGAWHHRHHHRAGSRFIASGTWYVCCRPGLPGNFRSTPVAQSQFMPQRPGIPGLPDCFSTRQQSGQRAQRPARSAAISSGRTGPQHHADHAAGLQHPLKGRADVGNRDAAPARTRCPSNRAASRTRQCWPRSPAASRLPSNCRGKLPPGGHGGLEFGFGGAVLHKLRQHLAHQVQCRVGLVGRVCRPMVKAPACKPGAK